jgi:DNA-directed RNA polymerase subunit RPC12/RpoP
MPTTRCLVCAALVSTAPNVELLRCHDCGSKRLLVVETVIELDDFGEVVADTSIRDRDR